MWLADNWKDYEVLDCSCGEKLERWGEYYLVRPDPQVIWKTAKKEEHWKNFNGHYHRSSKGGGEWEFKKLPEKWRIGYSLASLGGNTDDEGKAADRLSFWLQPFAFKHTGVFPEQAVNWEWFSGIINEAKKKEADRQIKVLNLFAYTGGATLAAAKAGAAVTHVDASKGMVGWAKDNAAGSGLAEAPIRYLVDDCVKFVERELRRGKRYDGIIMDPPSYGRGPKGEVWKIEDSIYDFIKLCSGLISDDPLFFLLNSYTKGLQPAVMKYMLETEIAKEAGAGQFVGVYTKDSSALLPRPISICGVSDDKKSIRLVYRVAGKGTAEFSGLKENDEVTLLRRS